MAVATPSFLPAKTVVAGLLVLGALGIPMPGSPEDVDYIEHRRRGLERFLKRVARHPILSASKLFIRFLEVPQAVRGSGLARTFGDASADGLATLLATSTQQSQVFAEELAGMTTATANALNIPGLSLFSSLVSKPHVRPCHALLIGRRPGWLIILHASLPPRWT